MNNQNNTPLIDLLFGTILVFGALFLISFLLINPSEDDKKVNVFADFIISMTWPVEFNDDIDIYMEDPNGEIVYFNSREAGLMHLDRDDLGNRNDRVYTPHGTVVEYKENREIITLRGVVPGEYVVNVHAYTKRDKRPVEVTIIAEKINPSLSLIASRTVTLAKNGDSRTAFRFSVDKDGNITDVNEDPKNIIQRSQNNGEDFDGGIEPPSIEEGEESEESEEYEEYNNLEG